MDDWNREDELMQVEQDDSWAAEPSEAYDNAEAFGQTLLRFSDAAAYVQSLYPDQMDQEEAVITEGPAE